jgi:hypothetical protein
MDAPPCLKDETWGTQILQTENSETTNSLSNLIGFDLCQLGHTRVFRDTEMFRISIAKAFIFCETWNGNCPAISLSVGD